MNKNIKKDICVLDFAFQRIGGKYKGRILWALSKHTVMRYGELSREISDISTKMLTQTLRELEMDNLIHREMYPQVPPKVEYSLTKTGKELIPFIKYLVDWGYKKMSCTEPLSISFCKATPISSLMQIDFASISSGA